MQCLISVAKQQTQSLMLNLSNLFILYFSNIQIFVYFFFLLQNIQRKYFNTNTQQQMGCTDSTQVLQNKSQIKPLSHSQLLHQNKNPMEIFMMGQTAVNKYLYKGLSWEAGRGVRIIDKQLPNVYVCVDADLKQQNSSKNEGNKMKMWKLLQHNKSSNKKQSQGSSSLYRPMNFSQITPIELQRNVVNQKYQHYLISGGINFALDNITKQSSILTIEVSHGKQDKSLTYSSHIHQLPDMNQARYTHTSLYENGYVYVTGGRYFGDDNQAILRSCQRINVLEWVKVIEENIESIKKKEQKIQGKKQPEQRLLQIKNDRWQNLPPMNIPRCTHITVAHNNCIYAIGGYTGDCQRSTIIQILNMKDIKQWVRSKGQLPYGIQSARSIHSAQHKEIMIIGGNTNHGPSSTVLVINLQRMTIRAGNRLNCCRMLHKSMTVIGEDNTRKLLIIGGHASPFNAVEGGEDSKYGLDMEVYEFMKNYEQDLSEQEIQEQPAPKRDINKQINNKPNIQLLKKHFISQDIFEALSQSKFIFYNNNQEGSMIMDQQIQKITNDLDVLNDQVFYIFGTSEEPFILQCNISVPYIRLHGLPMQIRSYALQGGTYLLMKNGGDHLLGACLLFGGISDCQEEVSDQTYLYIPHCKAMQQGNNNNICLTLAKMNVKRYAFTTQTILHESEQYYEIFAMGGGSILDEQQQGQNQNNLLILNKCEKMRIYHKQKLQKIRMDSKWEQIADLPKALISPMSLTYKNQVYVFGGMMQNKERYQDIIRYSSKDNTWGKIQYQFQFGLEAASIYQIKKEDNKDANQFLIFGGRVVNGDTNGIWQLTMLDKDGEGGENKDYGYSCVFEEKSKMSEAKCLHKVYKPKHQNFYVVFGGGKQLISCYDCESLKAITESDVLTGLKMLFVDNLKNLQDPTLKKYTIMSTL